MINWIMALLRVTAREPMEYVREKINYGFGEEGSDVHFVQVHGMLVVYAYDDWRRDELDVFSSTIHTEALIAAKRLKMPVRYYYRENGRVEFVHYDCRRRGIRLAVA